MKTLSEQVFACYSRACAPPPVGKGGSMKGGAARARAAAKKGGKDRSYLNQFKKSGKAAEAKKRNEERSRQAAEGYRRYGQAARAKNYATSTAGRGA